MRCGAIAEVEHDLVNVTPPPAFRRVIALDDRMARPVKVLRRVAVRRVVATADMTAGSAEAQMRPRRADLEAFLTAERARGHVSDRVGVSAFVRHHLLPVLTPSAALSPASARKACNAATTWAPSPTDAATRLTDPDRTSPIANTPGTLVSSGLRGFPWVRSPCRRASRPSGTTTRCSARRRWTERGGGSRTSPLRRVGGSDSGSRRECRPALRER